MRFKGKRIAITGGSGELGGRIVRTLVAEGAAVTVLDRQPPADAGAAYLACDLGSADGLTAAAQALALQDWDVLINLAGLQYFGPVEQEPADLMALTLGVNLLTPASARSTSPTSPATRRPRPACAPSARPCAASCRVRASR